MEIAKVGFSTDSLLSIAVDREREGRATASRTSARWRRRQRAGRAAGPLGKEDALFLPSGTMCNEVAYRAHTQPGDEIILHETSHAVHYEAGGRAALAGVTLRTLPGERGIFTAAQVRSAMRDGAPYVQRSRLVSVENTTNIGGGAVWPIDALDAVADLAHEQGLATHMVGTRLMNAVVASGQPAAAFAHGYDSAWIDLSKGLGAPVGGVLAGSRDFIAEAQRFKHQFARGACGVVLIAVAPAPVKPAAPTQSAPVAHAGPLGDVVRGLVFSLQGFLKNCFVQSLSH